MPQFMVMTLSDYDNGGFPTLVEGDEITDAYAAAAQMAVDEKKNSAQYVVYTMQQWSEHQPGHAVTVTIQGDKRTATWYPSAERPHPNDKNATTRVKVLDKTPKPKPEPEPEPLLSPKSRRKK